MDGQVGVGLRIDGGHFCKLLITFANNLDPDQDRQNVVIDLDSYRLIP